MINGLLVIWSMIGSLIQDWLHVLGSVIHDYLNVLLGSHMENNGKDLSSQEWFNYTLYTSAVIHWDGGLYYWDCHDQQSQISPQTTMRTYSDTKRSDHQIMSSWRLTSGLETHWLFLVVVAVVFNLVLVVVFCVSHWLLWWLAVDVTHFCSLFQYLCCCGWEVIPSTQSVAVSR